MRPRGLGKGTVRTSKMVVPSVLYGPFHEAVPSVPYISYISNVPAVPTAPASPRGAHLIAATLLTWTVLRAPPPGHARGRVVVLVELADGSRRFGVAASEEGLVIGVVGRLTEGDPASFEVSP